jgi:hypothetical protein
MSYDYLHFLKAQVIVAITAHVYRGKLMSFDLRQIITDKRKNGRPFPFSFGLSLYILVLSVRKEPNLNSFIILSLGIYVGNNRLFSIF